MNRDEITHANQRTQHYRNTRANDLYGVRQMGKLQQSYYTSKQACDNSGVSVESHFRDTTRDVTLGSGATPLHRGRQAHPIRLLSHCSKRRSKERRSGTSPELFCRSDSQNGNH